MYFGYDWPPLTGIGLVIFVIGLGRLLCDVFFPELINGHSEVLKRQSLYADVWALSAGGWLYWQPGGDFGLIIVITIAVSLWGRSHRELLRLYGR
jgi:hypothetical protein